MVNSSEIKIIFGLVLFLLIIERTTNTFSQKRRKPPVKRFHTKFFFVLLTVYLTIIFISSMHFINTRFLHVYFSSIGFLMLLFGILLRRAAIKALGEYWSTSIDVCEDQRMIKSGPFAYLKHPYYTAVMLELIGFSVLCNSFLGVAIAIFVQLPLLVIRGHLEERILGIYNKRIKFGKDQ